MFVAGAVSTLERPYGRAGASTARIVILKGSKRIRVPFPWQDTAEQLDFGSETDYVILAMQRPASIRNGVAVLYAQRGKHVAIAYLRSKLMLHCTSLRLRLIGFRQRINRHSPHNF